MKRWIALHKFGQYSGRQQATMTVHLIRSAGENQSLLFRKERNVNFRAAAAFRSGLTQHNSASQLIISPLVPQVFSTFCTRTSWLPVDFPVDSAFSPLGPPRLHSPVINHHDNCCRKQEDFVYFFYIFGRIQIWQQHGWQEN